MARGCSIPCNINGVERRIRMRTLQRTLAPLMPVIGVGVVLLLATPILIPLAGWQAAVVAAIFFLLGVGVVIGRALIQADEFTRLGVPAELDRIIDEHEAEIYPARVPSLRSRAAALRYDTEAYRLRVTQFLQELRGATGEAWRCRCRRSRFPLPLPF